MQTVAVAVAAVVLLASSATARRSAATQAVVERCISFGEAPIQENSVYIYDELFHVAKNPFLWKDYEPIPFDEMHPSMLLSATCELVQDLHAGLDELESETIATWSKVVKPLELLYDGCERVTNVFKLLAATNQSFETEAVVGHGLALARGFNRRLQQSTVLHALLQKIRARPSGQAEHSYRRLQALDHWISRMEERGVKLASSAAALAEFNHLDDEEAGLKRQFVNNVAHGTAAFHLTLRKGEHLRGVPPPTLAAMAEAASMRGLNFSTGLSGAIYPPTSAPPLDGAAPTPEWGPWTVTFDPIVYESMMAYCPNRRIRQLIYQSYESRASQAPWDNVPVVERLLQVRRSRARLLGAASYAQLVGRRQMIAPHVASKFLDAIAAPVASAALRSVLQVVRLMADSEALAEDIWGDRIGSNDLHLLIDSGSRLAKGGGSAVSHLARTDKKIYVFDFLKQLGMHRWTFLRIDTKALDAAEDVLSNTTLSRLDSATALADVANRLRNWDILYWQRKCFSKDTVKHSAGDFSTYFTLDRVLSGAFGLLNRLWGMHMVESVHDKPPVWHPDVRHFQLFNGSDLLGSFFFDPYARPTKLSVPFTQPLMKRNKGYSPDKDRMPIVAMSTSIRAPEPGEPTVLQVHDVLAVFHELGHVVQNLANQNNEVLIAGTTTLPLDFSQMFGQFFELWASEDYTLSTMAQNYKTHALLTPDQRRELAGAMRRMRPLMILEQLYMSKLDLSFHSDYQASATRNVLLHRHQVANDTLLLPYSTNNCDFCSLVDSFGFWHGAGYYSYLWSATFAFDAMGYFEEVGISNDTRVRALGNKMAAELLVDGTKNDAMSQYKKFRGRSASAQHLIAHLDV